MNRHINRGQRGAVLVVSLIMLLVLTLFAVSSFNLSSVNLKISGNFQEQKTMEAVAQEALEQVISTPAAFSVVPVAAVVPVCANGKTAACTGGTIYNVAVSAPKCNHAVTATGYGIKLGALAPEDTDWEVRAAVADPLGAQAALVQGVRVRLLAGNCPV
jgi:Tfp pilus assembly protein PilX